MQILSRLFFLLCLPALIWHAPLKADIPQTFNGTENYSNFSPWELLNYETLTVDNILNFVQMIEDTDNLEDIFTEAQMEEIQEFLIFLMRNGIRDWDIEAKERLEEDIAWMRGEPNNSTLAYEDDNEEEEFDYFMSSFNGYRGIKILPAVLFPNKKPEIVLCKGKLKKFYKSCKRAAKRHKKEIIIAAIVVAATVVIIASGGTATPEAVAGGASAIAGVNESSKSKKDEDDERPRNPVNKPGEVYSRDDYSPTPQDSLYPKDYAQNTSSIDSYHPQFEDIPKSSIQTREIVQQQTTDIKEELAELIPEEAYVSTRDEQSFWVAAAEKAKETGSHISHEVYEAVTDQLEIVPHVAGAFSDRLPESLKNADPFEKDPRDSFHEMVDAGHEKIDKIFGTDQSNMYSAEGKAARGELTTGMLPPPGSIIKTSSKFFEKNIKHIFRNEPGHLIDTPANRKLLLDVSGDPKNFLGVDKYGKSWHAQIQKDGTQIWSYSNNGEIRNGGVNKIPIDFHPETGLSKTIKPK
jgi:hypothetical protein